MGRGYRTASSQRRIPHPQNKQTHEKLFNHTEKQQQKQHNWQTLCSILLGSVSENASREAPRIAGLSVNRYSHFGRIRLKLIMCISTQNLLLDTCTKETLMQVQGRLPGHTQVQGLRPQKGPVLCLMLCFHCLEIPNDCVFELVLLSEVWWDNGAYCEQRSPLCPALLFT